MKIKTDSLPPSAPKNPQTSIVFQIFKEFASSEQIQQLENKIKKGCSWGEAKADLIQVLENEFHSKRETYNTWMENTQKIDQILKEGALQARRQAQKMLAQIRKTIGLDSCSEKPSP